MSSSPARPSAVKAVDSVSLAIEPGHEDAAWNLFGLHMRDGDHDRARTE